MYMVFLDPLKVYSSAVEGDPLTFRVVVQGRHDIFLMCLPKEISPAQARLTG